MDKIAWETEVWIAEIPDHLIHFNGDKFLGSVPERQKCHARRELGYADLWSDNPASLDLLAFSPVAETVASALLDDQLDPVVLGVLGAVGQREDNSPPTGRSRAR